MTVENASQAPLADCDVAIVGGGMVGATLALLLGQQGVSVVVIEAGKMTPQWQASRVDARVSALTAASRQLFETLGVWNAMKARRVTPYVGMTVWDSVGNGEVRFDAQDVMASALGYIVENSVITDALREALQTLPNVACLSSTGVTALSDVTQPMSYESGRTLTLENGRTLNARLVVASDGAQSPLRRAMGIGVTAWDTNQSALVTVVNHELPHGQRAQQVFLPTGPLAFLPLNGPHAAPHRQSSIVWSSNTLEAQRLMALDDDAFARALAAAFEYRLGDVTIGMTRHLFPLIQRHARRYVLPSFALIGDAAHGIHPLAGQGANLGFLDAAVLAEELARARQRLSPLGDIRVLARYEQRRRLDNAIMLRTMEAFCRGFGPQPMALTWLRNAGLRTVDRCLPLKRFFIRQALGERTDLPKTMQLQ